MIRFIRSVAFGTVVGAAAHTGLILAAAAQAADQSVFYSFGDKALVRCSRVLVEQVVHLDCEKLITPAADKN